MEHRLVQPVISDISITEITCMMTHLHGSNFRNTTDSHNPEERGAGIEGIVDDPKPCNEILDDR